MKRSGDHAAGSCFPLETAWQGRANLCLLLGKLVSSPQGRSQDKAHPALHPCAGAGVEHSGVAGRVALVWTQSRT